MENIDDKGNHLDELRYYAMFYMVEPAYLYIIEPARYGAAFVYSVILDAKLKIKWKSLN